MADLRQAHLHALSQQREAAKNEAAQEAKRLEIMHMAEMQRLGQEAERRREALVRDLEARLASAEAEHEDNLAMLRREHEEDMAGLTAVHALEIATSRSEREVACRAQESAVRELLAASAAHARALASVQEAAAAACAAAEERATGTAEERARLIMAAEDLQRQLSEFQAQAEKERQRLALAEERHAAELAAATEAGARNAERLHAEVQEVQRQLQVCKAMSLISHVMMIINHTSILVFPQAGYEEAVVDLERRRTQEAQQVQMREEARLHKAEAELEVERGRVAALQEEVRLRSTPCDHVDSYFNCPRSRPYGPIPRQRQLI